VLGIGTELITESAVPVNVASLLANNAIEHCFQGFTGRSQGFLAWHMYTGALHWLHPKPDYSCIPCLINPRANHHWLHWSIFWQLVPPANVSNASNDVNSSWLQLNWKVKRQ
jgi:hypothetical protein